MAAPRRPASGAAAMSSGAAAIIPLPIRTRGRRRPVVPAPPGPTRPAAAVETIRRAAARATEPPADDSRHGPVDHDLDRAGDLHSSLGLCDQDHAVSLNMCGASLDPDKRAA